VSPAHAATPGVGTSATSSSILDVALGTSGSLLNLKLLADEARSTIDPSVAQPEAFSRLNALSLTSSVLPAPLNNISLPMVESKSPGGHGAVAGPSFNLANPAQGLNLPLALLGGSITPANLTSAVDANGARSALTSALGNISLVGGLISATGAESVLGTNAKTAEADGSRTIKVGAINVLDLGALLNGLGIPLTSLPIPVVSDILNTLGVPVAGVPTSLTLDSFVDELNTTIDGLQAQLDAATQAASSTVNQVLAPVTAGILGGLGLPIPEVGDVIATVNGVIDQVQGVLSTVLKTALSALDGLTLLSAQGIEVGTITKAGDTVAGSAADIVAKIGSLKVGGLTVPGLDLGATLDQVNGVLNTVNGTLSSVLGSISPDLANIVKVNLFAKDANTGVTQGSGYVKSLAGVSALTAKITPPLNLDGIVSTLLGATDTIGSVLTSVGGTLPVLNTLMPTLTGLLDGVTSVLQGGATIKLASITSGASFTTPVAATNGSLPRTGGTAQAALMGMALVVAAVASRRFILANRAQA
jgi:hypothetical protein